jgi:galactokinase
MSREIMATAPGRICLAGEDIDWTTGPSVLCAVDLKTTTFVTESKDSIFRLQTHG